MSDGASGASIKNSVPVIDRMMDILSSLERRPEGATIRDLTRGLALPRTTVYRVLNTLQAHDMVRRKPSAAYVLGSRLLTLAARVAVDAQDYDLAALATPHLERLTEQLGEGSKISVRDGDTALVVTAVQSSRDYALTIVPGQNFPLHAGGASKMILAHLDVCEIDRILQLPLQRFTARTFTDPKRLAIELGRIRRQGWALDRGEHSISVHAYAAPIRDRAGRVVAALSVPYLDDRSRPRAEAIREAVMASAAAISRSLPDKGAR